MNREIDALKLVDDAELRYALECCGWPRKESYIHALLSFKTLAHSEPLNEDGLHVWVCGMELYPPGSKLPPETEIVIFEGAHEPADWGHGGYLALVRLPCYDRDLASILIDLGRQLEDVFQSQISLS